MTDATIIGANPPALGAGTQVGQYRIEELLGAGGMGIVYRATCMKLDRPAAIKFLSPQVADAEARRRFQLEARTASSLNHPHIVTVYDTGEFQDRQYLVTELVDGGTLRQWAHERRGWRPIVELLVGVADALATAHDGHLVHRDIKPENILVARNGYAKLADFGLAKLAATETKGRTETRTGAVLGTIDYMSPEQAAGRTVDARSDIFSFGVVLYELLAGQRPFGGASDYDRLRAIVDREPPPLPDTVPEALRALVDKALEKNPADRYQSMREVVVDLRRLAANRARADSAAARPRWRRGSRAWVAAGIVAAVAIGADFWSTQRATVPPANPLDGAKFTRFTNFPGDETSAALSPDGKFVFFVADRDRRADVWLGQVGTERFQNLTMGNFLAGTRSVREGGFTSDGSEIWIGGSPNVQRQLTLQSFVGGAPRPFLVDNVVSIDWSPDGTRLTYHTSAPGDPLFVADRDGANARQLYIDQPGIHNHFPTWSSDGRWIYFVKFLRNLAEADLWRIAATGGEPERLTHNNTYMAYPTPLDERRVLYVGEDGDGGGPWLWELDVESRQTRRVGFGLEHYTSIGASSNRRRLVAAVASPVANLWSVPVLDHAAGEADVRPYSVPTDRALAPRLRGGALYYLSSLGGGDGLWRLENGQGAEIWRGSEGPLLEPPAISADGRSVAVVLRRGGRQNLTVMDADGSDRRAVGETIDIRGAASWSPDGQWIVTGGIDATGNGMFKIPVGGGAAVRLADAGFNPVWSPRGDLILYAGGDIGGLSPLRAITPDGEPVDIPAIRLSAGGERFRFVPDGSGLLYMQGGFIEQNFWLLDFATKQSRQVTQFTKTDTMRTFDVTPDGATIVFDRLRQNSDIVLIDLPQEP